MNHFLQAKWVDWIYNRWPFQDYTHELIELDLHELIQEDINEPVTQDKIDVYENDIFLVLHFPKYNTTRQQYIANEFDIILRKEQLITLSRFKSNHMELIKSDYQSILDGAQQWEEYKFSSYYVLYRIIDTMYDKVLRGLRMFARDLYEIEDKIFADQAVDLTLLEQIMIKRRNIVLLKHMITPHSEIMEQLQESTIKMFGGEFDVYFEDLSYKIDKIIGQITVQNENLDSLYDVYSSLVSMKTNRAVTILTIFTAVIWVMTLITGWYGMNIPLPWQDSASIVRVLLWGLIALGWGLLAYFRYKKRR